MKFLNGRINRASYWLGLATLGLLHGVLLAIGRGSTVSEVVLIFLAIPRLHDFGRSGWWAGAVFAIEIACVTGFFIVLSEEEARAGMGLFVLALTGLLIWLGAIPGNRGDNRFGPPPPSGLGFRKASKQS